MAVAAALRATIYAAHWTNGHSYNLLLNCFGMKRQRSALVYCALLYSEKGQNYAIINKYQSDFDYIVFALSRRHCEYVII